MITVQDLRASLVAQGYSTEEVAAIKGKANLEAKILQIENEPAEAIEDVIAEALDDLEPVEDDEAGETFTDEEQEFFDDGHLNQEKLLEQLTDKEKVEGHPTVNGLRRLVSDYVGWIGSNTSRVVQCPSVDNNNRATVEVEVEIHFRNGMTTTVGGCADVFPGNTPSPFNLHPVATAESRAEGRAYRKALNLNITTAEEMGAFTEAVSFEEIQPAHIKMIHNMCRKCEIDLTKFLVKHNLDEETLTKSSREDGKNMCQQLSDYQSLDEIPEDIKKDDS